MDSLLNNETLSFWLLHYGGIALFCLLVLGILALPVPEETLMVIAGTLIRKGHLVMGWTLLAAYLGSMCGISLSYFLGKIAGNYFLDKCSKWLGITKKQRDKAHAWVEKYGTWSLFFGYFIPGVRHFTGIFAGITALEYRRFALYAYTGAFLWASLFLSIGYFFGNYFLSMLANIELKIDDILTVLIFITACILFFYFKKHNEK